MGGGGGQGLGLLVACAACYVSMTLSLIAQQRQFSFECIFGRAHVSYTKSTTSAVD